MPGRGVEGQAGWGGSGQAQGRGGETSVGETRIVWRADDLFGGVPLVKTGASFTVRVTASVVDPPTLVAATVNECSPPVVAAGVPVNIPDELRVSPDGSVPELTAERRRGSSRRGEREAVRRADSGRGRRRVGEGRRHHDLEVGGHHIARLRWLRPSVHCCAGRDRHHDRAGTRQRADEYVIVGPRSGDRDVADSGRGSTDNRHRPVPDCRWCSR